MIMFYIKGPIHFQHTDQDKVAVILQTFLNQFSDIKFLFISFNFTEQMKSYYRNQWCPSLLTSQGLNMLTKSLRSSDAYIDAYIRQ